MDFNGDGTLDLVGGQFGGFVYVALGKGKGQFAPPAKLKDEKGVNPPLHCSGCHR